MAFDVLASTKYLQNHWVWSKSGELKYPVSDFSSSHEVDVVEHISHKIQFAIIRFGKLITTLMKGSYMFYAFFYE